MRTVAKWGSCADPEQYANLAYKWIKDAAEHDLAAREIDDERDEEYTLHRELAATLRQCAQDLLEVKNVPPQTAPEDEIKF